MWYRAYVHADLTGLVGNRTVTGAAPVVDRGQQLARVRPRLRSRVHGVTQPLHAGDPVTATVDDEVPAVLASVGDGLAVPPGQTARPLRGSLDMTTAVQAWVAGANPDEADFILQTKTGSDGQDAATLPWAASGFALTVTYSGDPIDGSTGTVAWTGDTPLTEPPWTPTRCCRCR